MTILTMTLIITTFLIMTIVIMKILIMTIHIMTIVIMALFIMTLIMMTLLITTLIKMTILLTLNTCENTYNNITYINKCNIIFMILSIVISKVIYTQISHK
jgi:hypothetical protein